MWPARCSARVLIARSYAALAENTGFGHDPMLRSSKEVEFAPRRIVIEFKPDEFARLEQTINRQPFGPGGFIKAVVLRELERAAIADHASMLTG
jgi:hypothetical protein